jgi:hypothetical protein
MAHGSKSVCIVKLHAKHHLDMIYSIKDEKGEGRELLRSTTAVMCTFGGDT